MSGSAASLWKALPSWQRIGLLISALSLVVLAWPRRPLPVSAPEAPRLIMVTLAGKPAAGATLYRIGPDFSAMTLTSADVDGRLMVPPGIREALFVQGVDTCRASVAIDAVNIELRGCEGVSVTVLGLDERAIGGVLVTHSDGDEPASSFVTDASGTATVWIDRARESVLTADSPRHSPATLVIPVASQESSVRLVLEPRVELVAVVQDVGGSPVAGATVELAGAHLEDKKPSGPDGRAVWDNLPVGFYDVRALSGARISRVEVAVRASRDEKGPVTLTLLDGRALSVTVRGEEERALSQVKVTLSDGSLSSFAATALTNEAGVARFSPLYPGRASMGIEAPGFVPERAVPIGADETEIKVTLVKAAAIRLTVLSDSGEVVEGASVEVFGVDHRGMPLWMASSQPQTPLIRRGELGVTGGPVPGLPRRGTGKLSTPGWLTDAQGHVAMTELPPGQVTVAVTQTQYAPALSGTVSLKPGVSDELTVKLTKGSALVGRVFEENDDPVPHALVEFSGSDAVSRRNALTAPDGTFALNGLPTSGTLIVRRRETPLDISFSALLSLDKHSEPLKIILPEAALPLEWRVRDEAQFPVSGAQVRITSLTLGMQPARTGFTDASGFARIPAPRDGAVQIDVTRSGFAPLRLTWNREGPLPALVLSRGSTLRGRVVAARGRDVIVGARLDLRLPDLPPRTAWSAQDGTFSFDMVPQGDLALRCSAPDAEALERYIVVTADALDLGEMALRGTGRVTGTVRNPGGDAVVGARIALGRVSSVFLPGVIAERTATADAVGGFTLLGVPEGEHRVEALATGVGRGGQRIRVQGGETLDGVVLTLTEPDDRGPGGRGASLAVVLAKRGGSIVIERILETSTAERAGLWPGDALQTISGTRPSSLLHARQLLTGNPREDLFLEIAREGRTRIFRVPREQVLQ